MIEYKEIEEIPRAETIAKIIRFYATIFDKVDFKKIEKRIYQADNLLINLALDNKKIIGSKIGYQLDSTKFYSWLGGVESNYCKNGIAPELMKRQHDWAFKKGYKIVRTKTKNCFKPMLILNIKSGFDIVDVYLSSRSELKIVLEKKLMKS